jgi:hypothetical protein
MIDSDDYKFTLLGFAGFAILIITLVAINVGPSHDCKVKAIAAGMKSAEVQEACK